MPFDFLRNEAMILDAYGRPAVVSRDRSLLTPQWVRREALALFCGAEGSARVAALRWSVLGHEAPPVTDRRIAVRIRHPERIGSIHTSLHQV